MTAPSGLREWVKVSAAAVAILAVAWLIGPRRFAAADTPHYVAMVERGPGAAPSPFAYRVLTPALVRLLPLPPSSGFFVVTYAASFAMLLGMYALWRRFGVSRNGALLTLPLLGLSYPVAFYLGNWGLIDPVPQLLMVLALLSVSARRWRSAAMLTAAGCLGKDTSLLLVPLVVWNVRRSDSRGRFADLALAIVLPLAAFAAVRAFVTPAPGSWAIASIDDLGRRLSSVWSYNVDEFGPALRFAREILRSYGAVWIMAWLGLRLMKERRLEMLYLAGAGLAMCAIAADWSRMLGWGFAGFFIPAAVFIDRVRSRLGLRIPLALLALSVAQGFVSVAAFKPLGHSGRAFLVAGALAVPAAGAALSLLAWRRLRLFRAALD